MERIPQQEPHEENILRVEGMEFKPGDPVTVARSSGHIETDWSLRSFGGRFAVAEKVDTGSGEVLRKAIPITEFAELQKIGQSHLDSGYGRYEAEARRSPTDDELTAMAQKFGIDTQGREVDEWKKELNKKIREITGA